MGRNYQKAYILGSGSFGSRAYNSLQTRFQKANLIVVDNQISQLIKIADDKGRAVAMDAISFLATSKEKIDPDDWIVPAVPIHVAFEWLRQELSSTSDCQTVPVPEALEALLPNPLRGADGQLYASNADFICPDECPEPDDYCTVTGESRPQVLCDTMSDLRLPGYNAACIVSLQLAPGLGGFQWRTLLRTVQDIQAHPGRVLVSTACKCHGVMHALDNRRSFSNEDV